MTNVAYISHELLPRGDMVITVSLEWRGWFGMNREQHRYVGSGTVWSQLPYCRRASTGMERRLSDMWTKIRYDEQMNNPNRRMP